MEIKVKKADIQSPNCIIKEQVYVDMSNPLRELKAPPPLSFRSVGDPITNWYIKGASGGVGKVGKNLLKQSEKTLPSGSYGERVDTTNWITARTGTFNSGIATTIGFNLHKADNSNITPADVGKMFIAEGNADPETEGVELVIFQGGISQKGDDSYPTPAYHLMRYGNDGYGNIQQLKPDGNAAYIPIRCGTDLFELKPNTDYTFARVGGDSDVEIQYVTGRFARTVTIDFKNAGIPAIPDNEPTSTDAAQWCQMSTSERYNSAGRFLPVDNRAECYENCTAFATLKAGRYKVIAEAITKNSVWLQTMLLNDELPYFCLIDENNNKIMGKTEIFQSESLWHHEEYDFTLQADTKIGLFCKVYFDYQSGTVYPTNFFRFMIVNYNTPLDSFDIMTDYGELTGYSCWETFNISVPIIIRNSTGSMAMKVEIDLGTDYLWEDDVISYETTNIPIPTFEGDNTIFVNSPVRPDEMYIQYRRF